MRYKVELKPATVKHLSKLEKKFQVQVRDKIDSLAKDPRPDGAIKLSGVKDLYRLTSGNFRIIYQVSDDKLLVLVVKIGDRKDIYKNLADLVN